MSTLTIRRATLDDAAASATICYDAFYKINTDHGFPPDMASPEHVVGIMTMMFGHPGFTASWPKRRPHRGEQLHGRALAHRGIGPITIDPGAPSRCRP
jgi:hypothetical protein